MVELLESAIQQLQTIPPPKPESSASSAPELEAGEGQLSPTVETESPTTTPPETEEVSEAPPQDTESTAWRRFLASMQRQVPLLNRLPIGLLSFLVVAIAVGAIWATVQVLPSPSPETEVGQAPPQEIEPPPEVEAPQPPEPVATPDLELTPEQSLIAAIQEQVAEVTNQYAEGLIQTLEANFRNSRLIVVVGERWYELPPEQQDRLANEMLSRSRSLDFEKLSIADSEGQVLARSPVVGSQMVILQRESQPSGSADVG